MHTNGKQLWTVRTMGTDARAATVAVRDHSFATKREAHSFATAVRADKAYFGRLDHVYFVGVKL